MEDIVRDIKAYLYERVSNPFIVTFVVAWLIWNFRVMMMLVSDNRLSTKYEYLDEYFSGVNPLLYHYGIDLSGYFFNTFCAPFTLSLIYIFVSPFISLPVYRFTLYVKTEMLNAKKRAEDGELMKQEDARNLRVKMARLKSHYEQQIDESNHQIEALTEQINDLVSSREKTNDEDFNHSEESRDEFSDSANDASAVSFRDYDIEDLHEKIMEIYADGTERHSFNELEVLLHDQNSHFIRNALEDMTSWNWLFKLPGSEVYMLQPKGRAYVIEMIKNGSFKAG